MHDNKTGSCQLQIFENYKKDSCYLNLNSVNQEMEHTKNKRWWAGQRVCVWVKPSVGEYWCLIHKAHLWENHRFLPNFSPKTNTNKGHF